MLTLHDRFLMGCHIFMSLLSKREQAGQLIRKFDSLLCPVCQAPMLNKELALICENRHSFDIARQGYVNLLNQPSPAHYDTELFHSRNQVITESLFFNLLHNEMLKIILNKESNLSLTILDAGCGEGSHLAEMQSLMLKSAVEIDTAVGVDISKEGILEAAKSYQDQIWLVADLAKMPFKESTFDVILNILSPANYREFTRVLKSDGLIIKVIPRQGYLKELRESAVQEDSLSYSNEKIVNLFHEHFSEVNKIRINYQVKLAKPNLSHLLRMTPLTWKWAEDKMTMFEQTAPRIITVDFDILIGKK